MIDDLISRAAAVDVAMQHRSKIEVNEPLWHEGQDWAADRIAEAISAIPAAQVQAKDAEIARLRADLEAMTTQMSEWQASQHYRYIGRDGQPVLARDLEARAEEAEAERDAALAQAEARGRIAGLREAAKLYEDGAGPGAGGWDYFGDFRDAIRAHADKIEGEANG